MLALHVLALHGEMLALHGEMSRSDVGTACTAEPFVFGSDGRRELALLIPSQEGPAAFIDYCSCRLLSPYSL